MVTQSTYSRHHDALKVGMVSRPLPMAEYVSGKLTIPASGTAPRPGDAVRYVKASNDFRLPTTAIEALSCCGIIAPPPGAVGEAADGTFVHKSGDIIRVMIQGVIAVRAGAAMEFDDRIIFNAVASASHEYIQFVPANKEAADDYQRVPMVVVSQSPVADEGIAEVRLGGVMY